MIKEIRSRVVSFVFNEEVTAYAYADGKNAVERGMVVPERGEVFFKTLNVNTSM